MQRLEQCCSTLVVAETVAALSTDKASYWPRPLQHSQPDLLTSRLAARLLLLSCSCGTQRFLCILFLHVCMGGRKSLRLTSCRLRFADA
eukprot:2758179-Pleurochrysis_carterae.AAC.1